MSGKGGTMISTKFCSKDSPTWQTTFCMTWMELVFVACNFRSCLTRKRPGDFFWISKALWASIKANCNQRRLSKNPPTHGEAPAMRSCNTAWNRNKITMQGGRAQKGGKEGDLDVWSTWCTSETWVYLVCVDHLVP